MVLRPSWFMSAVEIYISVKDAGWIRSINPTASGYTEKNVSSCVQRSNVQYNASLKLRYALHYWRCKQAFILQKCPWVSCNILPAHTHTHCQSCWSHIRSDLWPLLWRSERTITVLIGNISGNYCPLPFFKELNRLLEILCSYQACFILTHTRLEKHAVKMHLCLIYNIKTHHVWVSVFAHMLWQNMIWLRDAWILRLA